MRFAPSDFFQGLSRHESQEHNPKAFDEEFPPSLSALRSGNSICKVVATDVALCRNRFDPGDAVSTIDTNSVCRNSLRCSKHRIACAVSSLVGQMLQVTR
jgi:hypothetical protein